MKSIIATVLCFYVSLVYAANHEVTVGTGGLIYNPNTVTAAVGDTIEFVVNGVSASLRDPLMVCRSMILPKQRLLLHALISVAVLLPPARTLD